MPEAKIRGECDCDDPKLTDEEWEAVVELAAAANAHEHKLVQHRDGKQPWCNGCGLDKNGLPIGQVR